MKIASNTRVIYKPGAYTLRTTCFLDPDGIERCSYVGEGVAPTVEDYLKAENQGVPEGEKLKVLTWSEAMPEIRKSQDCVFLKPWSEIQEETWQEQLEVLPPVWRQARKGVVMFYMSEAITSNIYHHYAQCQGRFFTCTCRASKPQEELEQELLMLIQPNNQPSNPQSNG